MSRSFVPEPSLSGAAGASIPEANPAAEAGEFEFVLGKRQVASVSLVALTALAAFTGTAYMVGKSSARTVEVRVPAAAVEAPRAHEAAPPAAPREAVAETPVFGSPEKDRLYIQVGSVERGFAALMVQGARRAGYNAIAAGGTNPNVYRVLVGPFADQDEYKAARLRFESMGLDTFSRKYSEGGKLEVTDASPDGPPAR